MTAYIWDAPTVLARCIGSAIAKDAPDVMRPWLKDGMAWSDRKPGETMVDFQARACAPRPSPPSEQDIALWAMFPQTWGDTSLGFGGMAGQSMTEAFTVVLMADHAWFLVYWGGLFGYRLDLRDPKFDRDAFFADLAAQRTAAQAERFKYFTKKD